MLPELHAALQRLLWERGQISPQEVDITFEAPTRERIEPLLRPTINLFLFEVQENVELRQTNWQVERSNARVERRQPPRRIDLRYMISALSTEVEDEHALLWRTLATLLKYPELPRELLPDELQRMEQPIAARTAQQDGGQRMLDVWSALGATPRPALYYVVTVPVDLEIVLSAPLVLTRTIQYRKLPPSAAATETTTVTGGVVRGVVRRADSSPLGGAEVSLVADPGVVSVANANGEFHLARVPTGQIRLRVKLPDGVEREVELTVPSTSYDVVVD